MPSDWPTKRVQAPRRLALLPRSGAIVPEFRRDTLREILVRPYRVIDQIRDADCFVVAIVHGSRDLARLIDPDSLPEGRLPLEPE